MLTNVAVKKVSDAKQRTEPVFAMADAMLQSIRTRAYELFSQRGFDHGFALEDWLRAEHEISWPAAELVEEDQAYQLTVELRGYSAGEIEVTVTPQEIIVSAASEKNAPDRKEITRAISNMAASQASSSGKGKPAAAI